MTRGTSPSSSRLPVAAALPSRRDGCRRGTPTAAAAERDEAGPPPSAGTPPGAAASAAPRGLSLRFTGIRHAYPGRGEVLRGIDLAVGAGEIVCLLGPSGCGKTTLLRLAAGLEPLQAGRLEIGGHLIAEPGREVPPEQRHVGFVFQDYALFPHLTVAENVAFGLRFVPRGERFWRVMDALARVGLEDYQKAYPHMLSGGQQQRVALARALAPRPAVLLLDEAFASLDARLREQVRDDTLHVLQTAGIATLLVTHDAEEAMFMGDRIALMREGVIVQDGTPSDLYLHPADHFVATFLGEVNRLPAQVAGGAAATPLGAVAAPGFAEGAAVEVLVRPEGIRLAPAEPAPPAGPASGPASGPPALALVEACRLLGATTLVHLELPDGRGGLAHLHARLPPGAVLERGQRVAVRLDPERAFVFPPEAS